MNIAHLLLGSASEFRDLPALARGTAPYLSYRDLWRKVSVMSMHLQGRFGLGRGERVALAMSTCVEWIQVMSAASHPTSSARRLERARRPDQPRLGFVEFRHADARLGAGLPRKRQVRGARDGRDDEPLARLQHLSRADHGEAADRARQRVRSAARGVAPD